MQACLPGYIFTDASCVSVVLLSCCGVGDSVDDSVGVPVSVLVRTASV